MFLYDCIPNYIGYLIRYILLDSIRLEHIFFHKEIEKWIYFLQTRNTTMFMLAKFSGLTFSFRNQFYNWLYGNKRYNIYWLTQLSIICKILLVQNVIIEVLGCFPVLQNCQIS